VRVLGEDLILFRDGQGRPGLVHPRCAHRGASLYYGRSRPRASAAATTAGCSRSNGRCLDQPCEPEGGKLRGNVRQPWYPLEERYGLVFAYLGPPEKKAAAAADRRARAARAGESLEADDTSLGGGGPPIIPCNWLQHWENVVDSLHVPILHGVFSGHQFVPAMAQMPESTGSDRARRARHQLSRSRGRPAPASASPRRRCRRSGSCRARASAASARSSRSAGCCRSTTSTFAFYVAGG
jgi:phenylpropionate dioxygenase-like ring-hydroxylating dioxygenase large terminal subunit